MPAQITINQVTRPPGVVNTSRSDLVVGQVVTCSNATAEGSYLWTLTDVPIRSALVRGSTATTPTFTFTPDVKGSYRVTLQVNGSLFPADTQTLFGAVLSFGSKTLGWRYFASGEANNEDNQTYVGLGFPGNVNPRGWSTQEDLEREQVETATWEVQNAVITTPGPGTNNLVRIDPVTGQIDPSLVSTGPGSSASVVSGITFTVPAYVLVEDVLFQTGASTADRASNNAIITTPALGIVIAKPTATTATVALYGDVPMTGLTAGAVYYLGTAGGITSTPLDPTNPVNVNRVYQKLGRALTTTTLFLKPEPEIVI